ncbi:MAG: SPFH domain-containing protein [Planctomycetota bacterium]
MAHRVRRIAGLVPAALALLWLAATSFVTVANDEIGVVERYGRPVRDLLPGLHMKLPWPFERVRRAPSPQSSLQMPIGFRLVDEAAGLAPPPELTRWLTGDSNIVELRANLLYRVVDPRAWLYGASELHATDPERPDGPWERPEFALRRLAEAALTERLSRADVDDVLTGGATALGREARALVEEGAERLGLGVEIATLQLVRRDPLSSVAAQFRAVQDEQAVAERAYLKNQALRSQILSDARIASDELLSEARQSAERLKQDAAGRAARFEKLSAEIGAFDSADGRGLRLRRLYELLERSSVEMVQPGTADSPTVYFDTLPR